MSANQVTTGRSIAKLSGLYVAMIVVAVAAVVFIQSIGGSLVAPAAETGASVGNAKGKFDFIFHVLITLAAVVATGHLLGQLLKPLGQPAVIGEVLAGIMLGPSFLGVFWPEAMHALIPTAAIDPHGQVLAALQGIAQLGIILYMFLVGVSLDASVLRRHAHAAVAVSHAGIVVPFVAGAALALWLYPMLSHEGISFASFALLVGVAMSVTAFPVLARILSDRKLEKTELGVTALGCAAADDVTAWCLLALVVGVAQAHLGGAIFATIGAAIFTIAIFVIVRPLAIKISAHWDAREGPLPAIAIPGIMSALLLSALATEAIGVHAVYGAFLLGVVVPHKSRLARELNTRVYDLVAVLLLPAFFAYTGMRTRITLLDSWHAWLVCGVILLVAIAGKFGAVTFAARFSGQSWRRAAALGTLMNTRGLMELIVLNIGLDLGIISPTLFAMMVLMALVTTALAGPVLDRLLDGEMKEAPAA